MMRKVIAAIVSFSLSVTILSVGSFPLKAEAASALTVDCDNVIREVTHCASGSLYGVTETIPSNISDMVTPLKPKVFTNPARAGAQYQQPSGGAIETAKRLTGTTGEVMIRLADLCPNWPYSFPGMSSWLSQVEGVITDKLASGVDNYYGYEIYPLSTKKPEA